MEKYGIQKTKYAIDNAFDIVRQLLKSFDDGVQVTDIFSLAGIGKDFYDIAKVYEEVKKESTDYSAKEIQEIIHNYGDKAISLFWKGDTENYVGIDKSLELLKVINDIYVVIIDRVKDGLQVKDLSALKEISEALGTIIEIASLVKEEFDNLNSTEVALIGEDLAMRILLLFK